MEERQKSLGEFLMKTSFTILTGLGGLSALLSGLAGSLNLRVPAVTMLLLWVSVALLLASTVWCWRVVSIPSGAAKDSLREDALKRARTSFIGAMIVLILSPIGLPLEITLSPLSFSIASIPKNVDLEYSGIEDNKAVSSPSTNIHFSLTVKNLGPAFTPSIEVTSPTNGHIIATLSQTALPLKRNDVGAVNCQVSVGAESEPGSYPLIVRVRSGDQIIKSEYIELEVKEHSVGLAYSGIEEAKVRLSPSESFSFTLTVTNLGPAFTPSIEVTSPTNAHIIPTLSQTALTLKRNDIAAVNCQVSVGAESEPGSYPLIVRVRSGDQIIKSEYIELEVKKE